MLSARSCFCAGWPRKPKDANSRRE
jgi:hypothetical protein